MVYENGRIGERDGFSELGTFAAWTDVGHWRLF